MHPRGKWFGLLYMLQGGSDASNDDPFPTAPYRTTTWKTIVTTGPHVMVVGLPGTLDDLPRLPDNPKKPYIMWGTPYEHIMMPFGST